MKYLLPVTMAIVFLNLPAKADNRSIIDADSGEPIELAEDYHERWDAWNQDEWTESNPPDTKWMEEGELEFYCQGENCGQQ